MNEVLLIMGILTACVVFIVIGFLMSKIYYNSVGAAYVEGQHDRDELYKKMFEMQNGGPTSPDTLRQSLTDMKPPCDVVFDTDIVTYFSSGVYARSWAKVVSDVYSAVTSYLKEQPADINTVVVRTIHVKGPGDVEFVLEGIHNPNVSSQGGPSGL